MVPVVPLFSTEPSKGKYWLFLKNEDRKINIMDKIWDRKSLAVVAGMKKPNDHTEPTKVEQKQKLLVYERCLNYVWC